MNYFVIPGLKGRNLVSENLRADTLEKACVRYMKLPYMEFLENINSRERSFATARFLCFYMLEAKNIMDKISMARMYHKDHASIIHGLKTFKNLLYVKRIKIFKEFDDILYEEMSSDYKTRRYDIHHVIEAKDTQKNILTYTLIKKHGNFFTDNILEFKEQTENNVIFEDFYTKKIVSLPKESKLHVFRDMRNIQQLKIY